MTMTLGLLLNHLSNFIKISLYANFAQRLLKKTVYNGKLVSIFFILNAKMFQLITKKDMSVEDGSVVVLE